MKGFQELLSVTLQGTATQSPAQIGTATIRYGRKTLLQLHVNTHWGYAHWTAPPFDAAMLLPPNVNPVVEVSDPAIKWQCLLRMPNSRLRVFQSY